MIVEKNTRSPEKLSQFRPKDDDFQQNINYFDIWPNLIWRVHLSFKILRVMCGDLEIIRMCLVESR